MGGRNAAFLASLDAAGRRQALTVKPAISDAASWSVKVLIEGLYAPQGIALDREGNLYIADTGNDRIEKWTAATGELTTLIAGLPGPENLALDSAGNLYIAGSEGVQKWTAATGRVSTLAAGFFALGVAVDAAGNVYFSDPTYAKIGKWTAATGQVSTVVVLVQNSGRGYPEGLAVDASGNLYIADYTQHAIRKWTAATGRLSFVAPGLSNPENVALDVAGNIYIADSGHAEIKKWNVSTGLVNTILVAQGGTGGVAVDPAGNLFVSDWVNNAINRWIAVTGVETAVASAPLNGAGGLAVDPAGNLFIADSGHGVVQKWIAATGELTPLLTGIQGVQDVSLNASGDLAITAPWILYWTAATGKLTTILPLETQTTTAGLALDNSGNEYWNIYSSPTTAPFFEGFNTLTGQYIVAPYSYVDLPQGLAVDRAGNLYIADSGNFALKKWVPTAVEPTTLVTVATAPMRLAIDAAGNLYFNDGNNEIWEWIAATGQVTALISSLPQYPQLNGFAVDKTGNHLYISFNNTVEEFTR